MSYFFTFTNLDSEFILSNISTNNNLYFIVYGGSGGNKTSSISGGKSGYLMGKIVNNTSNSNISINVGSKGSYCNGGNASYIKFNNTTTYIVVAGGGGGSYTQNGGAGGYIGSDTNENSTYIEYVGFATNYTNGFGDINSPGGRGTGEYGLSYGEGGLLGGGGGASYFAGGGGGIYGGGGTGTVSPQTKTGYGYGGNNVTNPSPTKYDGTSTSGGATVPGRGDSGRGGTLLCGGYCSIIDIDYSATCGGGGGFSGGGGGYEHAAAGSSALHKLYTANILSLTNYYSSTIINNSNGYIVISTVDITTLLKSNRIYTNSYNPINFTAFGNLDTYSYTWYKYYNSSLHSISNANSNVYTTTTSGNYLAKIKNISTNNYIYTFYISISNVTIDLSLTYTYLFVANSIATNQVWYSNLYLSALSSGNVSNISWYCNDSILPDTSFYLNTNTDGSYYINFDYDGHNYNSQSVTLYTLTSNITTTSSYNSATMYCTTNSVLPFYKWYYNNVAISSDFTDNPTQTFSNAGIYFCRVYDATNGIGANIDSNSIELTSLFCSLTTTKNYIVVPDYSATLTIIPNIISIDNIYYFYLNDNIIYSSNSNTFIVNNYSNIGQYYGRYSLDSELSSISNYITIYQLTGNLITNRLFVNNLYYANLLITNINSNITPSYYIYYNDTLVSNDNSYVTNNSGNFYAIINYDSSNLNTANLILTTLEPNLFTTTYYVSDLPYYANLYTQYYSNVYYQWYKDNNIFINNINYYNTNYAGNYMVNIYENPSNISPATNANTNIIELIYSNIILTTNIYTISNNYATLTANINVVANIDTIFYNWYNNNNLYTTTSNNELTTNIIGDWYVISNIDISQSKSNDIYLYNLTNTLEIISGNNYVSNNNVTVLLSNSNPSSILPLYEWYKDTILISSSNSNTYTTNIAGTYNVKLIDYGGSELLSNDITLYRLDVTIYSTSLYITNIFIPELTSCCTINNVIYQWYNNIGIIEGANSNTYIVPSADIYYLKTSIYDIEAFSNNIEILYWYIYLTPDRKYISSLDSSNITYVSNLVVSPLSYYWSNNANGTVISTDEYYVANSVGNYYLLINNGNANVIANTIISNLYVTISSDILYVTNVYPTTSANIISNIPSYVNDPITYIWYKDSNIIADSNSSYYITDTGGLYYVKTIVSPIDYPSNTIAISNEILLQNVTIDITCSRTYVRPEYETSINIEYTPNTIVISNIIWYNSGNVLSYTGYSYVTDQPGTYYCNVTILNSGTYRTNNITVYTLYANITTNRNYISVPVNTGNSLTNPPYNPYPTYPINESYPATLTANINVEGTFTYQWYNNDGIISGENSNIYVATLQNVYYVKISDSNVSLYSDYITIYQIGVSLYANKINTANIANISNIESTIKAFCNIPNTDVIYYWYRTDYNISQLSGTDYTYSDKSLFSNFYTSNIDSINFTIPIESNSNVSFAVYAEDIIGGAKVWSINNTILENPYQFTEVYTDTPYITSNNYITLYGSFYYSDNYNINYQYNPDLVEYNWYFNNVLIESNVTNITINSSGDYIFDVILYDESNSIIYQGNSSIDISNIETYIYTNSDYVSNNSITTLYANILGINSSYGNIYTGDIEYTWYYNGNTTSNVGTTYLTNNYGLFYTLASSTLYNIYNLQSNIIELYSLIGEINTSIYYVNNNYPATLSANSNSSYNYYEWYYEDTPIDINIYNSNATIIANSNISGNFYALIYNIKENTYYDTQYIENISCTYTLSYSNLYNEYFYTTPINLILENSNASTYIWYKGSNNIPSANSNIYIINSLNENIETYYSTYYIDSNIYYSKKIIINKNVWIKTNKISLTLLNANISNSGVYITNTSNILLTSNTNASNIIIDWYYNGNIISNDSNIIVSYDNYGDYYFTIYKLNELNSNIYNNYTISNSNIVSLYSISTYIDASTYYITPNYYLTLYSNIIYKPSEPIPLPTFDYLWYNSNNIIISTDENYTTNIADIYYLKIDNIGGNSNVYSISSNANILYSNAYIDTNTNYISDGYNATLNIYTSPNISNIYSVIYTWYKDNIIVGSNSSTYITSSGYEGEGSYYANVYTNDVVFITDTINIIYYYATINTDCIYVSDVYDTTLTTLTLPPILDVEYEWYYNGNIITDANSSTYITNTSGDYYTIIKYTSPSGYEILSQSYTITLYYVELTIYTDKYYITNQNPATLTSNISKPLTNIYYQWYLNDIPIEHNYDTITVYNGGTYKLIITSIIGGSVIFSVLSNSILIDEFKGNLTTNRYYISNYTMANSNVIISYQANLVVSVSII